MNFSDEELDTIENALGVYISEWYSTLGRRNLAAAEDLLAKVENDRKPPPTYKIVRFMRDDEDGEVVQVDQRWGLTLEQAQSHCQDPKTHGDGWFDGYEEES